VPKLVAVPAPRRDEDLEDPVAEEPPKLVPLSEITVIDHPRDPTNLAPLDAVLGGGLVIGSVVVISAQAGAGKSTLAMQMLAGLDLRALYATGEESIEQIAPRAHRVGATSRKIYPAAETDVDKIIAHARALKPRVIVIDSIHTLVASDVKGYPGSPAQSRESVRRIVEFAKGEGITTWLIGHVDKEGLLAGPATLGHLVDVVLDLEVGARRAGAERILRATKNRFGATTSRGYFVMGSEGLEPMDEDGWDEEPFH